METLGRAPCDYWFVIDSALQLHNFIIDHSGSAEEQGLGHKYDNNIDLLGDELNIACNQYLQQHPFASIGVMSNNEHHTIVQRCSRPSNAEASLKSRGT